MGNLLYKHEKPLFVISAGISLFAWLLLILGTVGIALFYVFIFFVVYLFAQSAFISYIKGTAIKLSPEQFPELYAQLEACCEKLNMPVPDTYILHAEGAFNALATRFLSRNYIILFSDVVDALKQKPGAINFYLGHELGHIERRHLIWSPILFPSAIFPLLGAAYSRAREYTCDNYGYACCENPKDAVVGLAVLSAGGQLWKTMNIPTYIKQVDDTSGFWMSFNELTADYPWLVKRVARLVAKVQNKPVNFPSRNLLAWFFAMMTPRTGAGAVGGAGGVIAIVAIVGILAAIAIPQFQQYRNKATTAALKAELSTVLQLEQEYYTYAKTYTADLEALGYLPMSNTVEVAVTFADENCFQAEGSGKNAPVVINMDCNGFIE